MKYQTEFDRRHKASYKAARILGIIAIVMAALSMAVFIYILVWLIGRWLQ